MDLLILGASARAAAFSALRAGLRPSCIDLFADQDLLELCPARSVAPAEYPQGLATQAAEAHPSAWIYTGALENHPDLVDQVSVRHRLLGNSGSTLKAVRDPTALVSVLRSAGLDAPEVCLDAGHLASDGSWLAKPRASAGGRGISPWRGTKTSRNGRFYFQQRVKGLPLSAIFVAGRAGCRTLGITRQLIGKPGNPFAYRGTLAPWPVSAEVLERIERIGRAIAEGFGLVGLFGVDLILDDDRVWPIEVNPRYTAAVEALEWANGVCLLADHVEACGLDRPEPCVQILPHRFVGKAIVHARRAFKWQAEHELPLALEEMPQIADVPAFGTQFQPGDPVLTVLASGDSSQECRARLAVRVGHWRRRMARMPG